MLRLVLPHGLTADEVYSKKFLVYQFGMDNAVLHSWRQLFTPRELDYSLEFYKTSIRKVSNISSAKPQIKNHPGCELLVLIANIICAGICSAQDSSSIFFSVKTTPAYYKSRLDVLKATWFQMVDRDKVS